MFSWVISFFKNDYITSVLNEGTSVKTPFGPGKIISGSVNVALDLGVKGPVGHNKPKPGNHIHITTTLDKIELL